MFPGGFFGEPVQTIEGPGGVQPIHTIPLARLPGDLPLEAYQGDSLIKHIQLWYGGSPIDLGGATLRAQVRYEPEDTTILATFETYIDADPESMGWFTITLTPEQTAGLPERAWWDLEITDSIGRVRTWLRGQIRTARQITQ
jgi:hypothetical protein